MKIKVEKIFINNSNVVVHFSSAFGSAIAFWEGNKPETNFDYNVEVDIDEPLDWLKDAQEVSNGKFTFKSDKGNILIIGILESVDDDGYAVLRIGDYIIPFLATGKHPRLGSKIKIITRCVTLSPFSYMD